MNLEELKARAKAALASKGKGVDRIAAVEAYLEAADPTTILSLIEEIERLREALERIRDATPGNTNSATIAEFRSWTCAVSGSALGEG